MRKFENVNIISSLRKIVDSNNLYYKSDYEKYDVNTFKEAAEGSHFLWISRTSGTCLFDERDVYIRNTYAHQSWRYYDTELYGIKAFAVTIRGNSGGNPFGDIYELDYEKHKRDVEQNSFNANTVDVAFQQKHGSTQTIHRFDIVEFDNLRRAIVQRYGAIETIHYNLADERSLTEILIEIRAQREAEAVATNINSYIREMVTDRFHKYGYMRNDMAFSTPEDAYGALKHHIPVYVLYSDDTAVQAKHSIDVDNAVYEGRKLGMSGRDKKLLNYFTAGNTLADLPFSHAELSAIFHMALDKGKDGIQDEQQRKAIDGIIKALDTMLYVDDWRDWAELELNRGFDEGMEP